MAKQKQDTGVARRFDYGDCTMMFRSAGRKKLDADTFIDGLIKAKIIGGARRDVAKNVLRERVPVPMGPWGLVVTLVGQPWVYLVGQGLQIEWPAKIAAKLGVRAATFYADGVRGQMYVKAFEGKRLLAEMQTGVPEESKGKGGFSVKRLDDGDTLGARGPLLDGAWLARQKKDRAAFTSVAAELDAYVPLIWTRSKEGAIAVDVYTSRKLKREEIERIDVVVFGPAATLEATDSSKALKSAIDEGDAAAVRAALAAGASPDFLPDEDESPLIRCLRLGLGGMYDARYCRVTRQQQLEVLAALLEGGADLKSKTGDNPIGEVMDQLDGGDERTAIRLLTLLIEHGADPNALCDGPFFGGCRPLYVAAMRGKVAVVKFLLAHGADPKLPNHNGKTPLQQLAPSMMEKAVSGNEMMDMFRSAMINMAGAEAGAILDDFLGQKEDAASPNAPTRGQEMTREVDAKRSAEEQCIDLLAAAEAGKPETADWPQLAEASYRSYAAKTRAFRRRNWAEDPGLQRELDERAGHTRYDTLDGDEPTTLP